MKKIILLGLVLGLTTCTKKANLGDFDTATWQADKGGCQGKRAPLVAALKALKPELKAVSANDIGALFGKPDIQRLDERNQEYYVYFTEAGPHCGQLKPISDASNVMFRFNALGLTTEITFQK